MDVVGLYPNIPHGESQFALKKRLETRKKKEKHIYNPEKDT